MFAIRARRKVATERDFLDAVEKVVRQGTKFSSTYVLLLPMPVSEADSSLTISQTTLPGVQLDHIRTHVFISCYYVFHWYFRATLILPHFRGLGNVLP